MFIMVEVDICLYSMVVYSILFFKFLGISDGFIVFLGYIGDIVF